MSVENLIAEGQLTEEGKTLANSMFMKQCDRRPCSMCSMQNRRTKGPGCPGCPAPELDTREEVDQVLTLYMGRAPGLEALVSLLSKKP